MDSLQDKSFATHFDHLVNMIGSEAIVKKCIMKYLQDHKKIVSEFIAEEGLFNVFMRQQDSWTIEQRSNEIRLVESFVTYADAEKWIKKNGHDIVEFEEDNYGTPIVLTIIHPEKNRDIEDDPASIFHIAGRRYPTFAFSEKGYQMLLYEHLDLYCSDWCSEIIPKWIYWIKKDGGTIRGCFREHILNIHSRISYTRNNEQRKLQELEAIDAFWIQ